MATTSNIHSDPQMSAAIAEVTELIRKSYPDTTLWMLEITRKLST